MIDKSEQWKLNGNCSLCRKKSYCGKPCTKYKRETRQLVRAMVANKINEMTGGAYKTINNVLEKEDEL